MAVKKNSDWMTLFRETCRRHDLRVTPQRAMIYETVLKAKDHPTPEQVMQRLRKTFPHMSLDTVYRSLATLREIGLVDLVEGHGPAMRYDPVLTPHHHFRCRQCGQIMDFDCAEYDQLKAPRRISTKCEVLRVQVTVEGICEKCRKKKT